MRNQAILGAAVLVLVGTAAQPAARAERPPKSAHRVHVTAGTVTKDIDLRTVRGNGSISGRLVDQKTGAPLVKQAMTVYDSHGQPLKSDRTDRHGKFSIGHLPHLPGGYRVCMPKVGYPLNPDRYPGVHAAICYPHAYRSGAIPSRAKAVLLAAGQHRSLGTIKVPLAGLIRGRVETAQHVPLGSALVIVRSRSHPHLWFRVRSESEEKSRLGEFAAGPLPPSPKGWQVCADTREAAVWVSPKHRPGYSSTCYQNVPWTNPAGAPARRAVAIHVRPGTARTHLRLVSVVAGRAQGRVTYHGKPAVGWAYVSAVTGGGHAVYLSSGRLKNGRYRVGGLPPGRHRLQFCANSNGNFIGHCATRTVHVHSHVYLSAPPLKMTRGSVISGTVTDANGRPVSTDLDLLHRDGRLAATNIQSDAAGRYRVAGLEPSKSGYFVCAVTLEEVYGSNIASSGCYRNGTWSGAWGDKPEHAKLVRLGKRTSRTGIDLRLPSAGSISGEVTDANGSPVRTDIDLYSANGRFVYQDVTRGKGRYKLEGLSPGSYYVCAESIPYTDHAREFGTCYRAAIWTGEAY